MHTNVRRFIKTGIGFLVVGLAIGAVMIVRRELYGIYAEPHLSSAHAHAVQLGFVMILILGSRWSGSGSTSGRCGPGSARWGAICGRRRGNASRSLAE